MCEPYFNPKLYFIPAGYAVSLVTYKLRSTNHDSNKRTFSI